MATQHFLQGSFRGKLGATVGAEWRGIPTLRTYAKPKQPNTPAQLEHKARFRTLIFTANQLHKNWLLHFFDPKGTTTISNQFITFNKAFFDLKTTDPEIKFPYEKSIQIQQLLNFSNANHLVRFAGRGLTGEYEGDTLACLKMIVDKQTREVFPIITDSIGAYYEWQFDDQHAGHEIDIYMQPLSSAYMYQARRWQGQII